MGPHAPHQYQTVKHKPVTVMQPTLCNCKTIFNYHNMSYISFILGVLTRNPVKAIGLPVRTSTDVRMKSIQAAMRLLDMVSRSVHCWQRLWAERNRGTQSEQRAPTYPPMT